MPKKDLTLGRSLIKAQKRQNQNHMVSKDGYRHTADLADGRDFARLNLKSCTEQTSLKDFLSIAELAESDFNAEFDDVQFVDPGTSNVMSEEEKILLSSAQDRNKNLLCIPRRPSWDETTSKEELDAKEKEAFLTWRRKLAVAQEEKYINFTPFEKNLEVWRQLWRVIERSNVIVQILDARNPLLFRCLDLEAYVKEIDKNKTNMLLLNKADFLTDSQRQSWSDYFEKNNIQVVFFSALQEMEKTEVEDENSSSSIDVNDTPQIDQKQIKNSPKVLSREELIHFIKSMAKLNIIGEQRPTVGLVGYPNVGKSSTINAILMSKKVSVSATPGKTKHFQTFIIDQDLCLCDCPGLVFPNFVSTKAEMVINGILPIDQLTEWNQPVSLVTNVIPRKVLESTYSILIPIPSDKDPNIPPTAEEFLNAHGYNRGFMTQRGLPDNARSARYILKDFINGKLLFCYAPPDVIQEDYHKFTISKTKKVMRELPLEIEPDAKKTVLSAADKQFFQQAHIKSKGPNQGNSTDGVAKPWKKHNNRNRKEKLRRVYKNPYA